MATNFPASLDTLTNPTSSDSLSSPSHSAQHANANDAIEALQAKVGADSSAVTSSHDYLIADHASRLTTLEGASSGKILQIVQATKTTYFGTSSLSFVDTGLAVTITPSDATSKVLLIVSAPIRMQNSNYRTIDTVFRGAAASGTNLGGGFYNGFTVPYSVTSIASLSVQNTFHFFDSPSTTSATTYNHAARATAAGGAYSLMADEATAVITAIEVAA